MKSTTQRFSLRPKNRLYLLNVTKPGEVPAILQQGETVVPAGGAMPGQGARGHTFNISIATPNPAAFADSQGQIAAMLSQAVSRGNRNL